MSEGPKAPDPAAWRRQAFAFLVLIAAAAAWAAREIEAPLEIKIALGFFVFFLAPGLLVLAMVLPDERLTFFERLPLAIVISMGVWAPVGLIAYRAHAALDLVARFELALIGLLAIAAFVAAWFPSRPSSLPERGLAAVTRAAVLIIGLLLAGLAFYFGALRGPFVDWDLFNYVSAVRKLLAWDHAAIAHFAYRDAPPDPIHSYNIWGLQWALLARTFAIDPIPLYLRSAFLTVPAAAFAFFGLAKKLVGERAALTALLLYTGYHVIYGGLAFLGRTTFYPADSQWLIGFPATLWLYAELTERWERGGAQRIALLFVLALTVLGLSANHVLWGLAFYLTLAAALSLNLAHRYRLGSALARAWKEASQLTAAALILFLAPYLAALAAMAAMANSGETDGFTPLTAAAWLDLSPWTYGAVFLALPCLLLIIAMRDKSGISPAPSESGTDQARSIAIVIAACLAVSLPYILLRYEVVQATNWSQFGRNPYRALITAGVFFLNPFQLTLADPNMTFYPLGLAGYLALPWLIVRARGRASARIALAALLVVPIIVFHPVLATLFAKFFSLGYLRRILRLAAIFSLMPLALAANWLITAVLGRDRRLASVIAAAAVAAGLALVSIPFTAEPWHYNHLLPKNLQVARQYPPDSLIFDDAPFQLIRQHRWFANDAVIFSDIWTSYRLTAYLPQFVAVQHKPGTGVADQDQRRLMEDEFFQSETTIGRMREVLDRFGAEGVILNTDPTYRIYQFTRGRPEVAAKLKADPFHFEILSENDDWSIFRYWPQGKPNPPEEEHQCPALK